MKILILSYETFNNVGEELLGDSTEYLFRSLNESEISRAQLVPSYKDAIKYNKFAWLGMPLQYIGLKLSNRGKNIHKLWKLIYYIRLKAYYECLIRQNDLIVLAVGMLKFRNQNFSYIYSIICDIATRYHKDVIFNAMSIAKADNEDLRYHQLVDAINMPCVKGISTRDGDAGINLLRKCYIDRPNILIDEVGDPALWIPQVYNLSKNVESTLLGINVINPSIYANYNFEDFSKEQVESLYKEIVSELESRKYNWVFFCNGMSGDYAFGKKLLEECHLPPSKLFPCPKCAEEYLHQIVQFKAVFGARLHSDISAVALGIPVVGLLWDSKLKYFSETMGISQFFVSVRELNGKAIVNKLEEAMNHDNNYEARDNYKTKTKKFLGSFIFNN